MAQVKLAELLLRRKELTDLVKARVDIRTKDIFTVKTQRKQISETIDDITMTVPKLTFAQVVGEHDYYARQLRLVDALIQKANWNTDVDTGSEDLFKTYEEPAAVTAAKSA